ncbi:hypothetical protein ACOMHN_057455 [Nucella lapillus]
MERQSAQCPGPADWKYQYAACGRRAQSPINIDLHRLVRAPTLGFLPGNYGTDHLDMALLNNGHTVEVEVSGHNKVTLRGGGLPSTYTLAQFHFHWGSRNSRGSEHTLDGRAAPMEMHLVHYRDSYGSLKAAADKKDGLAVLSFLFNVSHRNEVIQEHLLSSFNRVHYSGSETEIHPFALDDLLPRGWKDGVYFRYQGSLTTPPCHESVIWTVFNSPIQIATDQLDMFRSLQSVRASDDDDDDDDFPISDNFRPVQNLNSRQIGVKFFS